MTVTSTGHPLDERDATILADRMVQLNAVEGFRCGDWVIFADGVTRRISYIWDDGPQTSAGGTYFLGHGYVSMSGGLYPHVPKATLTLTDERRDAWVWFFHHDFATAHNGVDVMAEFRVYTCSLPANT